MTLCLEKARRAWVRLPRPLHAALLELRDQHPEPVVFGTSQFVRFEPLLSRWKLTVTRPIPNPIKTTERVDAVALNALGVALATHLTALSNDRRTNTPLMPLADVLAGLPPPILDWITGTPPIQKHEGGILFEALGVLMPTRRGDAYNPSRELLLAIDELNRRGGQAGTVRDGPVAPALTDFQIDALNRCLNPGGVPYGAPDMDGRTLRALLDKDGAGLITLRETSQNGRFWIVPNHMRGVAAAMARSEPDMFALLAVTPKAYREWVCDGLPLPSIPEHPRLLAMIGVIKRKGKYDWQFTRDGAELKPRLVAMMNAEEGVEIVDDTPYIGDGVDITLDDYPQDGLDDSAGYVHPDPNSPVANGIDLTLDDAEDPFDILGDDNADKMGYITTRDGGPQGPLISVQPVPVSDADRALAQLTATDLSLADAQFVEAPIPSDAELAEARLARELRALTDGDEFDTL